MAHTTIIVELAAYAYCRMALQRITRLNRTPRGVITHVLMLAKLVNKPAQKAITQDILSLMAASTSRTVVGRATFGLYLH